MTRFVKTLLSIMEHGVKPHSKHLTEYFAFLYEFAKMGEEEVGLNTQSLVSPSVLRDVCRSKASSVFSYYVTLCTKCLVSFIGSTDGCTSNEKEKINGDFFKAKNEK